MGKNKLNRIFGVFFVAIGGFNVAAAFTPEGPPGWISLAIGLANIGLWGFVLISKR